MSEDTLTIEVFEILADEYARAILTATANERQTAPMLAETINAANSTVYDRINRLLAMGFLEERTHIADDGNHYSTYQATLDRLNIRLTPAGLEVETETVDRDTSADRLSDLWRELR